MSDLIFQDTFTDANGTAITAHTPDIAPAGSTYSTSGVAAWAIQGNKLNATGIDGGTNVATIDLKQTDGTFQAEIATTRTNDSNRANAAMVLRFTDTSNFNLIYFFNASTGPPGIYAQQTVAGVTTQLGGVAMTLVSGATHTLTVAVRGNNYGVYVDGVFSFSFTTSANSAATKFGYFTNAVGTPPASPTWDNASMTPGARFGYLPGPRMPVAIKAPWSMFPAIPIADLPSILAPPSPPPVQRLIGWIAAPIIPIRVPWAFPFGHLPTPLSGGLPPPPAPPKIRSQPLLLRVPDVKTQQGVERLRRFTEMLSQIVNSLTGQHILIQTGPASWTIASPSGGGVPPGGLTGTFNSGIF